MREFVDADDINIFTLDSDPLVQKYVGASPLKDIAQAREAIKSIRKQYVDNGIGRWAVLTKNDDTFIGWAGLKLIGEPINGFVEHYDVDYRLIKEHWGKGYGTECSKATVKYGFDVLKQKNLHAYVHQENVASKKTLEKTGFVFQNSFEDDGDVCDWYCIGQ